MFDTVPLRAEGRQGHKAAGTLRLVADTDYMLAEQAAGVEAVEQLEEEVDRAVGFVAAAARPCFVGHRSHSWHTKQTALEVAEELVAGLVGLQAIEDYMYQQH